MFRRKLEPAYLCRAMKGFIHIFFRFLCMHAPRMNVIKQWYIYIQHIDISILDPDRWKYSETLRKKKSSAFRRKRLTLFVIKTVQPVTQINVLTIIFVTYDKYPKIYKWQYLPVITIFVLKILHWFWVDFTYQVY